MSAARPPCPSWRQLLIAVALLASAPSRAQAPAAAPESQPPPLVFSAEDRAAEDARWTRLGLKVPKAGLLLEHPFQEPFTARAFVVPTAWFEGAKQEQVMPAALAADLPLLKLAIERAYGGYEPARRRGWDWDAFFDRWRASLDSAGFGAIPLARAFAPWAEYQAFQRDNHSGVVALSMVPTGSRSMVLKSEPQGPCTRLVLRGGGAFALDPQDPAQRPRRALEVRGGGTERAPVFYLAYPSAAGEAERVVCGGAPIDLTPVWTPTGGPMNAGFKARFQAIEELSKEDAELPTYRRVEPAIAYVRIPSGSKETNERLEKLVPTWPRLDGRERVLIIDLRSNGGGDNGLDALAHWIAPKRIMAALSFTRTSRVSCVASALAWGYQQFTARAVTPPISAALKGQLQASMKRLFAPTPAGCPAQDEERRSKRDYRAHRFDEHYRGKAPRLLVLVDSYCGSDCELMTYVLAQLPETVVVGANTFGVGQFTQPGYFMLPYSRVPFRLARGASDIYGDGRSFDGYGLDVDLLLVGEDAWKADSILALARSLAR